MTVFWNVISLLLSGIMDGRLQYAVQYLFAKAKCYVAALGGVATAATAARKLCAGGRDFSWMTSSSRTPLIDGKEAFVIVPRFGFGARKFDAVLLDVDSTSTVNFVAVRCRPPATTTTAAAAAATAVMFCNNNGDNIVTRQFMDIGGRWCSEVVTGDECFIHSLNRPWLSRIGPSARPAIHLPRDRIIPVETLQQNCLAKIRTNAI